MYGLLSLFNIKLKTVSDIIGKDFPKLGLGASGKYLQHLLS